RKSSDANRAAGIRTRVSNSVVIPGRAFETKLTRSVNFAREARARNPYARPRVRLVAFAAKISSALLVHILREWPKGQARCGYGFRARRFAASRNDKKAILTTPSRFLNASHAN